jgi:hypothetical protein
VLLVSISRTPAGPVVETGDFGKQKAENETVEKPFSERLMQNVHI